MRGQARRGSDPLGLVMAMPRILLIDARLGFNCCYLLIFFIDATLTSLIFKSTLLGSGFE